MATTADTITTKAVSLIVSSFVGHDTLVSSFLTSSMYVSTGLVIGWIVTKNWSKRPVFFVL
jgi:hypothetical protein